MEILESAAKDFNASLLRELLRSKSIEEAFNIAKKEVAQDQ